MGLSLEASVGTFDFAQVATVLRSPHQHTLQSSFRCEGIGLHTGKTVQVQIHPAPVDAGRYFVRTDLPEPAISIPAHIAHLHQTRLSTELSVDNARIRTVEHVLAALVGLGIDNARIDVNGPEIPLLDGSSQPWIQAILNAGWHEQPMLRQPFQLDTPVAVYKDDAFVTAIPAPQPLLTYGIDFPHPAIGCQWHSMALEDFAESVAPARTFGFAAEVNQLRADGLIKGGSLENALVCGSQGWLNPPLRYANEPVRHKLLDLLGDLSLLGGLPSAHIVAYKASHALHTQLVQRLASLSG